MRVSENRRITAFLFVTILVAGALWRHPVEYDNSTSRFLLTKAIVENGTFSIDPDRAETVDRSLYDGRYYSNKAPGAPWLGVPVYWVMRQLPQLFGQEPMNVKHRYLINLLTTTISFALLAIVLWKVGTRWCGDAVTALLMVLAFCFGTIAWIHATRFSGHLLAGACCFFSFALLLRLTNTDVSPRIQDDHGLGKSQDSLTDAPRSTKDGSRGAIGVAVLAGLCAGIGALCDFLAMYLALLLSVYALSHPRLRHLERFGFLAGGGLCALLLGIYNAMCFGSPWSFSYQHTVDEKLVTGHNQGLMGFNLPDPIVLMKLLFSPAQGLFFIMPVLLFSAFGLVEMWRRPKLRLEAGLLTAASVGLLCINASYYFWGGGWSLGPRYLVPILPFLAVSMTFVRLRHPLFFLAWFVSCLQVVPALIGIPYVPEEIANPLIDLILPLIGHGYFAENWFYWLGLNTPLGAVAGLVCVVVMSAYLYTVVVGRFRLNEKAEAVIATTRQRPARVELGIVLGSLVLIIIALGIVRTPQETAVFFQDLLLSHAGLK